MTLLACYTSTGGIAVRAGASATLVDITAADCAADDCGGGFSYVDEGANLTFKGGRVERCRSTRGGAVLGLRANVAMLEGNAFSDCRATYLGGGLYCWRGRTEGRPQDERAEPPGPSPSPWCGGVT